MCEVEARRGGGGKVGGLAKAGGGVSPGEELEAEKGDDDWLPRIYGYDLLGGSNRGMG